MSTSTNLFVNPINGNVGIGTTNPQGSLHVNGTLFATLPINYYRCETSFDYNSFENLALTYYPSLSCSKNFFTYNNGAGPGTCVESGTYMFLLHLYGVKTIAAGSVYVRMTLNGEAYGAQSYINLNAEQSLSIVATQSFPINNTFSIQIYGGGGTGRFRVNYASASPTVVASTLTIIKII